MRSPLRKRVLREIVGDWPKYIVIAAFLILMIGVASGMFVANESMLKAASDGKEKYLTEDGHFELKSEASDKLIDEIEKYEKTKTEIIKDYYKEADENKKGKIRLYKDRNDVNVACLIKGKMPEKETEIAIDRMHADNQKIKLGDRLSIGNQEYKVTGLISVPIYTCLFEKNTDLMFDAINFDVGYVTEEGFGRIDKNIHYNYAWLYKERPEDKAQEKKFSDRYMKEVMKLSLMDGNSLEDYLPSYLNQGINFAPDDMEGDLSMVFILVYILVAVIAFIFAITISSTISKESGVVGTLRASGYSRAELFRHYLSMPLIVTVLAAFVGNVLGYTIFKDVCVNLYYNSYSLPTYETIWNSQAFVITTIIPVVLMICINSLVLIRKLKLSPLQFLRHELKRKSKARAFKIPDFRFMRKFRCRVLLQNMSNYFVMLFGIVFIMVMMCFATGLPDTLSYYQNHAADMMMAKEQVLLKSIVDENGNVIETNNPGAEKISVKSLYYDTGSRQENITFYGMEEESRYVEIPQLSDGEISISRSFHDKYHFNKGDRLTLHEKYEDKEYDFTVADVNDYTASLSAFVTNKKYNDIFDLDEKSFNGFLTDETIFDIDEKYIAGRITSDDITKMTRQLDHSMGGMMGVFSVVCVILSMVLIFLLTRIIIEKNENSISMMKILGFRNNEISSIYVVATTTVVIISEAAGLFFGNKIINMAWNWFMTTTDGWFAYYISREGMIKMLTEVLLGYVMVMIIDMWRIRKIPMDQALKNI